MTVIMRRSKVKMSGLSHKYVNINKMPRKYKKRATKSKISGRKLNSIEEAFRQVAETVIKESIKDHQNQQKVRSGRRIPVKERMKPSAKTTSKPTIKKGDEGTGGYSQWTQRYAKGYFGKLTSRKIDSMSLEKVILTHRRIGPFNDYGQFFMENKLLANGNWNTPLILFELNSTNNYINGTLTNHAPVKRLYQSGLNIAWDDIQGQQTDGTASLSAAWQVETSAHTTGSSQSFPGENAIHKWSSLDLELWGTRNKPTKYDIMLVQFSEDVLPDWGIGSGIRAEFFQSLVKQYTYSPLAKMDDGYNKKKMKIMKHYKVNIDPTANYENDPDPHVKTFKLYYKFNRKCNFAWQNGNNPTVQTIANMNDADWNVTANQNQNQVHPNARIYVMVRASNYAQLPAQTAADSSSTPSISWRMRTCYLTNQ